MNVEIERFSYDDDIVRKFTLVTLIWGIVGMLVGLIVALQLASPFFNLELPWTSFGRLRPLHTNAVIFAFAANAVFAGVYYSMQRLLKTPMFSRALSLVHFWGWQAIIVGAAITLPLGFTQGKEYAELEWPIDIAVALIWVVFAINVFGTIAKRRERHLYVAIWFYIATLITIAMLHIFNSLVVPAGLWRSYSLYAGVQDAFMQWWYGHNAVGFLLTTPFLGILLYIVSIYAAGLTQGLMWLAFDDDGYLKYGDFVETTLRLIPMYWVRVIGGTAYLAGALMLAVNMLMTWRRRPAVYEVPVHEAPALSREYRSHPEPVSPLRASGAHVADMGYKMERFFRTPWHRAWERLPVKFTAMVAVAVVSASLFEIVPTFLIKSNVPTIATVKPYTPLELAGRDIYLSEGCYNCHSQMIRPIRAETERYGEYSKPGEFVYDHPFQWGSRRIGPDLQRVGGKYSDLWHVRHMDDPRAITQGSIMPAYPWMLNADLDFEQIPRSMRAHRSLGVPYTVDEVASALDGATEQADLIAAAVVEQGGPAGLEGKQIVALIAYLQRMGTDITRPEPTPPETEMTLEADLEEAASVEIVEVQ